MVFKSVQVILSHKGQVLGIICGFSLASVHIAFNESEIDERWD